MTTASNPTPKPTAKPLSREEVLDGLGGRNLKQTSALLLLIETRTAHLLADSRQATSLVTPTPTRRVQAHAYLQTLAQGRHRVVPPTIRDLERYARQWAELVPDNASVRAMTAHLLGEKYRFPRRMAPGIRAALGLDDASVQQAYQQIYNQPLSALYREPITLADRLRWRWARLAGWLENLSPFWSAFALTLVETVGAGILALPIALAQVGPLAGVVLLLVLGFVNILTLVGVTEAITRYGPIRYGYAFFGQLVQATLGRAGMLAFSLALLALNLLASGAYYIGVTTALADATTISPLLWSALLFLICFYFLRRQSIDATIASALVIGCVNLLLILILVGLTLPYLRLEHLSYMRLPGYNVPFAPQVVELIFGIVLTAYFGHTAVGNVAKVVLRRDPSGRTLLWGNIAALAVAMVLYSIWIIAVNGSIAPTVLAAAPGTALGPLAATVGPVIHLFGGIFAVLGMGMASIHFALALFNQMQEWLPTTLSSRWLGGSAMRFGWGILPSLLVFLAVEWMLYTGQASFAGPLGLVGALVAPLLAGIFPVLLLVVTRRQGDYVPGTVWRWLGHPLVLAIIYLLFFTGLLAHGLVIWPDPLRRSIALAVCAGMLVLTWLVLRHGALTPRTVVEVRLEQTRGGRGRFQVASQGKPLVSTVEINALTRKETLQAASGEVANLVNVRSLRFHLPATQLGELKLWLHEINADGESSGLAARCLVHRAAGVEEHQITATQPEVVLPWDGAAQTIEVFSQQ
jgi:amino acid permease